MTGWPRRGKRRTGMSCQEKAEEIPSSSLIFCLPATFMLILSRWVSLEPEASRVPEKTAGLDWCFA